MSHASDIGGLGRELNAGDVLFREGEPGDAMFVIQEGAVRLTREIDGEPTTIAELTVGDFAGELSVLRSAAHTTTATATAPTRCLALDSEILESMVTTDSEIAIRIISTLADRLASSREMMSTIGCRDTRTRVCMALIRHAKASTEERDGGVWVDRRLGDIGDEIAISKTELGEISKQFLRHKLLRIKRDGIMVPDVSRLYEFMNSTDV